MSKREIDFQRFKRADIPGWRGLTLGVEFGRLRADADEKFDGAVQERLTAIEERLGTKP